jgi:hypothetical protein
MLQPTTTPPGDDAAAVRAILLDGACAIEPFAKGAGKSERTIYEWIKAGMPVTYLGRTPFVLVGPARDWIRNRRIRGQQPRQPAQQPRRPGRPIGPTQKRKP